MKQTIQKHNDRYSHIKAYKHIINLNNNSNKKDVNIKKTNIFE